MSDNHEQLMKEWITILSRDVDKKIGYMIYDLQDNSFLDNHEDDREYLIARLRDIVRYAKTQLPDTGRRIDKRATKKGYTTDAKEFMGND